ncbi:GTPase family protein [Prevotella pectinovora]|uniref:GTPase family protein n=1 Tax=Prevotella pectinovora TaxID=1602169 RepID=UPI0035228A98
MNDQKFITPLDDFLSYMESSLSPKDFAELKSKIQTKLLDRAPVVAIIGKAGVGKTTTINNLFDVEDFVAEALCFDEKGHIGDVKTGTTRAIRKHFDLKAGIGLDIIDLPGLGDDVRKDPIYEKIYAEVLPQCDIVLYILKADNRTLGEDERIINNVVLPSCDKSKLIVAVNQVDILGENEGLHWEDSINLPSERQEELIKIKQKDITNMFSEDLDIEVNKITCYSALKRYHLLELLESIVSTTPLGFIFAIMGIQPRPFEEIAADQDAVKIAMQFVNNKYQNNN